MNIAKAVGKEAQTLSDIKALKTKVKAIVKERKVKVRGKTEARQEKKGDCHQWSNKGSCSRDPTPALTTMILKSAPARQKEKGKNEEGTPRPLLHADALPLRRKRNALVSKKATVLRERIARTRIPLRAGSFLKVNAKIAKTVTSHTLSPNTLMQEETLLTWG